MRDVQDAITEYISNDILHSSSGSELDPDLNLLAEGILDSLGLQMLIGHIEQSFGITIDDDALLPENFQSITAISELVSGLKG